MDFHIAHKEWGTRPVDQRFQSLADLEVAVTSRRDLSREVVLATEALKLIPTEHNGIEIQGSGGAILSNWSFGQAAALGGAPAGFLRELPAPLAADVLNYKLARAERKNVSVLVGADPSGGHATARAFTSERYGRIWDADVVRLVRDVVDGTSWKPPLGYEGGRWGAPLVPSGLYASDRDSFIFMVDETRPIEHGRDVLHRGFIVRNSEVGAATFEFLAFLYRTVCGNNIIHGGQSIGEFKVKHLGNAWSRAHIVRPALADYVASDPGSELLLIDHAKSKSVGSDDSEVGQWLKAKGFTKAEVTGAIDKTHREENGPENLWAVVQGLTAYARERAHTDERVNLERRAGALLGAN